MSTMAIRSTLVTKSSLHTLSSTVRMIPQHLKSRRTRTSGPLFRSRSTPHWQSNLYSHSRSRQPINSLHLRSSLTTRRTLTWSKWDYQTWHKWAKTLKWWQTLRSAHSTSTFMSTRARIMTLECLSSSTESSLPSAPTSCVRSIWKWL